MSSEPFLASKLKVNRAKHHISELDAEIAVFLERNPQRVVVEDHGKSGLHTWVIRIREQIPKDFPLLIGDAVHNLRAALDLLACELVRLAGQDPTSIYFPFANEAASLETVIKRRNIDRAAPDVVDIIRSLKPYKGGNNALRAIHDLDITDKHKLLIPVIGLIGVPDIVFKRGDKTYLSMSNVNIIPAYDGYRVMDFPPLNNVGIGHEFNAILEVLFGDGQPFQHHPVVPTLRRLTQLVHGIICTFESHCIGKQ